MIDGLVVYLNWVQEIVEGRVRHPHLKENQNCWTRQDGGLWEQYKVGGNKIGWVGVREM